MKFVEFLTDLTCALYISVKIRDVAFFAYDQQSSGCRF